MGLFSKSGKKKNDGKKVKPQPVPKNRAGAVSSASDTNDRRLPLNDPGRKSEILACGSEYIFLFLAPLESEASHEDSAESLMKDIMSDLGVNYNSVLSQEVRSRTKFAGDLLRDMLKSAERVNGSETLYQCGIWKKLTAENVVVVLDDEWTAPMMSAPIEVSVEDAAEGIEKFFGLSCGGYVPVGDQSYTELGEINCVSILIPAKIDPSKAELQKLRTLASVLS
jgi:hypothetical protein